jgi:hypothetical protein
VKIFRPGREVARLLDAAPGLKYKTALGVAYGAACATSSNPLVSSARNAG